MRTAKLTVAVCAAFALAACGATPPMGDTQNTGERPGSSSARQSSDSLTASRLSTVVDFGAAHRFPSGLVIKVSSPNIFEPSDTAYPRAPRAAAFGVEVYNDGQEPYRLSRLSVRATITGQEIKQVQDAPRGYNGIVDADRDIAAGGSATMTLAFAVREEPQPLRLVLRPDTTEPVQVVFTGSV